MRRLLGCAIASTLSAGLVAILAPAAPSSPTMLLAAASSHPAAHPPPPLAEELIGRPALDARARQQALDHYLAEAAAQRQRAAEAVATAQRVAEQAVRAAPTPAPAGHPLPPRSAAHAPAAHAPAAAPAPTSAPGGPWNCIRARESGGLVDTRGNYAEPAGGAYGITWWGGYGGYARAADAPPAVQDAKALELQRQQGWRPWSTARACGLA